MSKKHNIFDVYFKPPESELGGKTWKTVVAGSKSFVVDNAFWLNITSDDGRNEHGGFTHMTYEQVGELVQAMADWMRKFEEGGHE